LIIFDKSSQKFGIQGVSISYFKKILNRENFLVFSLSFN